MAYTPTPTHDDRTGRHLPRGPGIRIRRGFHAAPALNTNALPGIYTSTRYESYTNVRIKAESSATPVFPMTISSNINATTATRRRRSSRAPGVGTARSVYVFALAPRRACWSDCDRHLRSVTAERNARSEDRCGGVRARAAQRLGTAAGGVGFVAAGVRDRRAQRARCGGHREQRRHGLNIGGATFYVGYGPNASTMLNDGLTAAW